MHEMEESSPRQRRPTPSVLAARREDWATGEGTGDWDRGKVPNLPRIPCRKPGSVVSPDNLKSVFLPDQSETLLLRF